MNRRRTLMLAIAGVAGIASPSTRARAGAAGGRRMLATAPDEAGGLRGTKAESKFRNLKAAGPELQVVSIGHHRDIYSVATADGRSADFQEADLRFKIDSSDAGPFAGKPVILAAGSAGDRASVFFASPAEISTLIKQQS
jgi:cytochrome c